MPRSAAFPRLKSVHLLAALLASSVGCSRSPEQELAPAPVEERSPPASRTGARAFFSGHSLLDNPLPDHLQRIAESQGIAFDWNQQNGVGSSLRVRTNGDHTRTWSSDRWQGYRQGKNRSGTGMDVLSELRDPKTLPADTRYDTLIITERHDLPYTLLFEDTIGYLRHFHDRFIEANPDATTYFYHVWIGFPDKDKTRHAEWRDYEARAAKTWECVVDKVNLTLQAEGRRDRLRQMPGTLALVHLVEKVVEGEVRGLPAGVPGLERIFSDDVHLTPLGKYFMASVMFSTVFGQSPEGAAAPEDLEAPGETIEDLQRMAWAFAQGYTPPSTSPERMAECRAHTSEAVCPTYWTVFRGEPHEVETCQQGYQRERAAFFSRDRFRSMMGRSASAAGPFAWPDPNFKVHPAPR